MKARKKHIEKDSERRIKNPGLREETRKFLDNHVNDECFERSFKNFLQNVK